MPFDHFDLLAPLYDRLIKYHEPQKLIDFLDLPLNSRILDAGGGTGRVGQWLHKNSSQTVIVDLSIAMLRQAADKKGLVTVCSKTEEMPFPDYSFDRIVMVDTLHHVINQVETAQEMWRLVKPGGKIVIEELNIDNFGVKLVAIAEKIALMRSRFLSGKQIAEFFYNKGSQVTIEYEGYNIWVIVEKSPREI